MTFRIHFTINGYEDSVDISGEDIEEVKKKVGEYFNSRGVTYQEVDAWSEEV